MKISNNVLISVIIPAFNHEDYVKEAIQSVIDQTYDNLELIVIDDGSTDSTFEKIKEMQSVCIKRFNRFVFYTKSNEGTTETLNKLIMESYGEYIVLCASDDKFTPNAISDMYEHIKNKPNVALVFGENKLMDSKSKECYWDSNQNIVYEKAKAVYKSFTDFLRFSFPIKIEEFGTYASLLKGNYIGNGYLIRKNIFNKIGHFTKEAPLEDYWMMLQISKYAKINFLDKTTFYYRWHNSNTVKNIKKMQNITYKTLHYEMKLVKNLDNGKWKYIFEQNIYKIKPIVKIAQIMAILKYRSLYNKKIVIKILNTTFTLFTYK